MPNNLQGETIPMTYSRFLDNWNDKREDTINYPSSNIFEFGEELEDVNKENSSQMKNTMKQSHENNNNHFISL
jgi:hypothetical protein